MILTMDIGNSTVKIGVWDNTTLRSSWRISTAKVGTSDELGILLHSLFTHQGLRCDCVTGCIYSSVVPTLNFTIEHMCRLYFELDAIQVSCSLNLGITVNYDHPQQLGTDRIANAVAAHEIYGGPCVFIDFGTATTFGVVSKTGRFEGGVICPGIKLSAEALVSGAAKLPRVELNKPDRVIGKNTISNIQAGLVYGFVGQIEYLVRRIKQELNADDAIVIATGGMAKLVASETSAINETDSLLTLKGLRILYERNRDGVK
ncbi:MAG: type III pantothenate kinase [Oscillospiraceae bacterium]|jgi:type III pantothenate kinase|nr:type III pantothenate kinase [Oscillospiraceae bacterium]